MLVFGVDIPLVEVVFTLVIIVFIILIEAIVAISLLISHMNKSKKLAEILENLAKSSLANRELELSENKRK